MGYLCSSTAGMSLLETHVASQAVNLELQMELLLSFIPAHLPFSLLKSVNQVQELGWHLLSPGAPLWCSVGLEFSLDTSSCCCPHSLLVICQWVLPEDYLSPSALIRDLTSLLVSQLLSAFRFPSYPFSVTRLIYGKMETLPWFSFCLQDTY